MPDIPPHDAVQAEEDRGSLNSREKKKEENPKVLLSAAARLMGRNRAIGKKIRIG